MKGERWYEQSVRASGTPGHLRLVMNLEALVRSPHFRSYWIQRNVQQLRQYQGGVCDAHLTASEIREERVLLRPQAALGDPTPAGGRGVAELLRLVPDTAGLYRIWDSPSADRVADILETKILSPRPRLFLPGKTAPGVHLSDEPVGTEADLETRIDEAPPPRAHSALDPKALQALLGAMKLEGMLHFQSSKLAQRDVLVANESAVAILALSDWNAEAARGALLQSIESLWTVSRLGTQWVQRQRGAYGYYELDGLARLAVATQGRLLIVADGPDPLLSVLERASIPPGSSFAAIYAAGFRHSLERDNFARMMRLMDYPSIRLSGTGGAADGREPQFFSENIASLSRVLARVETASIIVRDNGSSLAQTLIYRLRR